jgi:hypothetical protein
MFLARTVVAGERLQQVLEEKGFLPWHVVPEPSPRVRFGFSGPVPLKLEPWHSNILLYYSERA